MEGASRFDVEEEEPRVRGIPSAPTSVFGAVGVAERGPIGKAVLCTSPDRYREVFGDYTAESDLALAAMGFFENGGGQLWCVRTVHYDDPADPTTASAVRSSGLLAGPGTAAPADVVGEALPLHLFDGDELVFALSGGSDLVVAFRGSPAFVPTSETGPFALADGHTLRLVVDDGREQTVTFEAADFADIGARYAPIDLALLPIGAYEPRAFMAPVHANPEEAVRMHQDLGARRSIGMHWGTFRLTTEPMNEPPQRLRAAMAAAGLPEEAFTTVALGETLYLDEAAAETASADPGT